MDEEGPLAELGCAGFGEELTGEAEIVLPVVEGVLPHSLPIPDQGLHALDPLPDRPFEEGGSVHLPSLGQGLIGGNEPPEVRPLQPLLQEGLGLFPLPQKEKGHSPRVGRDPGGVQKGREEERRQKDQRNRKKTFHGSIPLSRR